MEGNKLEEKRNAPHYAHGIDTLSEDGLHQNRVALTEPVNLSDGSLEKGTVLEISSEQVDMPEIYGDAKDFFCDESLFSSFTLGAGNGIPEDDDSSNDDSEPFEKLARKMEDVSGDGGVLKMEVWPGTEGDIPKDAVVTFHYSAFLEYTDEPFDSTHLRNRPERKKLDGLSLLPGITVALKTMRKGETSRFLVRPQYAYGETGCPPRIPGNESILYEIHVISFVDEYAADAYDNLEYEVQQRATFQQKLEGARGFHRKGNDLYREGDLKAARNAYMRATWIMEDAKLKNEEEEALRGSVLIKVRSNLAQVFLDLKEPAQACTQCKLGLAVRGVQNDDIRAKLFFRLGKAKTMLCDFDSALADLRKAQRLRPYNADICAALESLVIKKEKYEKQEKFIYQRMFQSVNKVGEGTPEWETSAGETREQDKGQDILRVRPEFQKVVEGQIMDFANDPNVTELPFPSNLSQAEIACVAAASKAANLKVTLIQRGMESYLKIAKNN